jgi:ATP-dependent Lon protease
MVWTPVGGDIIFIEAAAMKTNGRPGTLVLTGQLGDVMRESAQAALTYVRSRSGQIGVDPAFADIHDIHIHVPAGATPKDGPSAGITIATALASLMTGRLVRSRLAMTGEITLSGKVLPIGGVKEKVLASHRAGIRTILLPKRNRKDYLEDVPAEVRDAVDFHFMEDAAAVLELALEPPTAEAPAT